jgi:hypothetical protein
MELNIKKVRESSRDQRRDEDEDEKLSLDIPHIPS